MGVRGGRDMGGRQSACREDIGNVLPNIILALGGDGFALRHEERGDGGQRELQWNIVERRREGSLERRSNEWLEAFPGKDDLAALECLFSLSRRQIEGGVGGIETG